mgnify:CR=1 FL=1
MTKVIGVRFRTAGKIYFFAPGKLNIQTGDKVIVETARGVEFGTVVTGEKEVEDDKIMQPLKPVIRMATDEDRAIEAKNKEKEKEAFKICQEKIKKHNLEMKLMNNLGTILTFGDRILAVGYFYDSNGRSYYGAVYRFTTEDHTCEGDIKLVSVSDETFIDNGHAMAWAMSKAN